MENESSPDIWLIEKARGNVQRRFDIGKENVFAVGHKVLRQNIHEEQRQETWLDGKLACWALSKLRD